MTHFIYRQLLLSLTAAVAVLSGACTTLSAPPLRPNAALTAVPDLQPGLTVQQGTDVAIDRWWLLFNDDALNALIDEALLHNADLETALARVHEAQAGLDVADAARRPALDWTEQHGREQRSEVGAMPLPPGVDRETASHKAALQASYEVDLWGRLSSASKAARNQLLASEWARATVEWSLTAKLAETYFNLAAVDRQIDISEAARAGREATVVMRRREQEAGAGNQFDLRRAQAELTHSQSALAGLRRQRVALEHVLLLLLGRNPAQLAGDALPHRPLAEDSPTTMVLPQGVVGGLLVRRPDIRQAEFELAAANANVEVARAASLPGLRLTGSIGSDARSISDLFSAPATVWSLAAGVTQSLLDGGRNRARLRSEQARAEQALAGYRKNVIGAVLDVREAYASLDLTEQAWLAESDRVAALSAAHDIARAGFAGGALAYLELLDAERNWYQAQLDKVSAFRDRLLGQVAAYKALGGGYDARASQIFSGL